MYIFEADIFGLHIAPSYYGLMYAISFIIGYLILKKTSFLSKEQIEDLFLYIVVGVILGGRLGYVLFYDLNKYLQDPISIFKVWEGGMSFHGGLLGVIIALSIFAKIKKVNLLKLGDEIAFVGTIGLFLGRIGNYINKELLGFEYNGFLAVEKGGKYFFPSPLVEAFLEGIILFLILFFIRKNKKFDGQIAGYFLLFYGIFRIFVECFFRTPDRHIGYIFGFLTMGIILSLPLIIIGIIFLIIFRKGN